VAVCFLSQVFSQLSVSQRWLKSTGCVRTGQFSQVRRRRSLPRLPRGSIQKLCPVCARRDIERKAVGARLRGMPWAGRSACRGGGSGQDPPIRRRAARIHSSRLHGRPQSQSWRAAHQGSPPLPDLPFRSPLPATEGHAGRGKESALPEMPSRTTSCSWPVPFVTLRVGTHTLPVQLSQAFSSFQS